MAPGPHQLRTATILEDIRLLFEVWDEAYARAPAGVEVSLGGTLFECRADDADYLSAVRTTLAEHASAHGVRVRLLAAHRGALGLPAALAWGEKYFNHRDIEALLAPTAYRCHGSPESGFWQFFDRETGRGLQFLSPSGALPPWDLGAPFRNFLHWHFTQRGQALVHAGTLAREGHGVLLAGPGGSGKSGTVLAGLAHGLDSVGDDYVLLRRDAHPMALPLFRTLKQDPAGFARLGLAAFAGVSRELNWQGKHQFTLADITARPLPEQIRLRAICLPMVTGAARTEFVEADPKEAFLVLTPSSVSQMPGDRGASFAFGAALARQLPAYRMRLGTHPAEIADAMAGFIARLS